jgi:hypothetical protein
VLTFDESQREVSVNIISGVGVMTVGMNSDVSISYVIFDVECDLTIPILKCSIDCEGLKLIECGLKIGEGKLMSGSVVVVVGGTIYIEKFSAEFSGETSILGSLFSGSCELFEMTESKFTNIKFDGGSLGIIYLTNTKEVNIEESDFTDISREGNGGYCVYVEESTLSVE